MSLLALKIEGTMSKKCRGAIWKLGIATIKQPARKQRSMCCNYMEVKYANNLKESGVRSSS